MGLRDEDHASSASAGSDDVMTSNQRVSAERLAELVAESKIRRMTAISNDSEREWLDVHHSLIELTERRAAETSGELCPHGMPLAANVCGPCSQGRPNRTAEHWLGELLAIVHCDGGHYQARHGTEKAVADAIEKWNRRPAETNGDLLPQALSMLKDDVAEETAAIEEWEREFPRLPKWGPEHKAIQRLARKRELIAKIERPAPETAPQCRHTANNGTTLVRTGERITCSVCKVLVHDFTEKSTGESS